MNSPLEDLDSSFRDGAAFGFLVAGPIHSLALPRTVVDEHATCAHAQLRPGKSLVTTEASAHFRDLHPHSAVELLETGAWEALGHGFHDISAVTTHQLIVHLDSPPSHHEHVRVLSE